MIMKIEVNSTSYTLLFTISIHYTYADSLLLVKYSYTNLDNINKAAVEKF